jgi:hypothetical protein
MAELLRHRQNERGGNRQTRPNATAPPLDSTRADEKQSGDGIDHLGPSHRL